MERFDYEDLRRRWGDRAEYGILDRKVCNSTYIARTSERWSAENIVKALNASEHERQLSAALGEDFVGAAVDAIVAMINSGGTDATEDADAGPAGGRDRPQPGPAEGPTGPRPQDA